MKWVSLAVLCCFGTLIHSQQALTEVKKQAFGNPFNSANESFINMMNGMESPDQVSLLLFDSWQPIEILGKDATLLAIDSANYHIRAGKIIFVIGRNYFELFPERIDHVVLGDRLFISTHYLEKKNLKRAYFEVLEEGDFTLLKKHKIVRNVINDNPLGLPAAREIELKQGGDLYFLTAIGKRPEKVPTRKRELIMSFRRDRAKMAVFASEHKLSLRRNDDVRALFAHYNSLADEMDR